MIKQFLICLGFIFTCFPGSAEQITINISAKLRSSTCSLSSGSDNSVVNMTTGLLNGKNLGVPFGLTPFNIIIENCPLEINTVNVRFTGASDEKMPNLLQINSGAEGEANGVAIGLYDMNITNLDIRNNFSSFNLTHSSDINKLSFYAAYVKTSGEMSPGKVTGVTSFEISYD